MNTPIAIACAGIRKRFRRYSRSRPDRLKDVLLGNWRGLRPEAVLWALQDVSFSLERGRMLGVIGHNGAGKSTLLRLVGGVSQPDAGSLRVNGRIGALLDLGLGFHPELTGRENAYVNGVISGLTRREVARRMDDIVGFAELEAFIDAPLRTYSSGMRLRLGFAIAAHTDPEVLLIDEVLSVGDLSFQNRCMERIAHFKREGTAILLVSHNVAEVRRLCDQVLWLEKGQVRRHGTTAEVVAAYEAAVPGADTGDPITPVATATAAGVPLTMNENRFGTLEVELTDVRVPAALQARAALPIEMAFVAHRALPPPIIQVKLVRDDGVVCCDLNSHEAGIVVPMANGRGRVRLWLDRHDLAGGAYFVEVGLYHENWERMFDYHARAYRMQIDAPAAGEGVLRLPARWELPADVNPSPRMEMP
ncbi:ABC transporter ATP-binding protein [Ectothiorhodospiraceae bacterium 2226]|nr:ABC transporter ATP-binding protein [Ectothiorhodospiraceae bacterium 2226]